MKQIALILLGLLAGLPSCSFKEESRTQPGTIVLLNGTSSAGKTSIMKELQNIYGDSYVTLVGDDFAETYTPEPPLDESMPRDIQQLQVLSALFSQVKQLSLDGKNVFVDVVEFDNHYEQYCSILDCKNIVKVLVYCPLDIVVDRVKQRNESGQEKETRPLNLSFAQFQRMYKLQESPNEMIIDHIATEHMKYALHRAKEEVRGLMKEAGVQEENLETNLDLFAQPFVKQFKLDSLEEIILVPQHSWDLIVNTGTNLPTEAAEIIGQYLKTITT